MSEKNCERPELRPKDGNCSEELIERCHGKEKKHPCKEEDTKQS